MHFATSSDALIPFHVVDVVFLILRNLGSSRRLVASVPMERRPRGIQDQYRKTTAKSKKLWFCNIIHNNNIVLYSLYMFVYARALLRTLVCVCIVHCRHALFVCVSVFLAHCFGEGEGCDGFRSCFPCMVLAVFLLRVMCTNTMGLGKARGL